MAKILYISLTGMTESLGESQVVQYLLDLVKFNSIYLLSFEREIDSNKHDQIKNLLSNANIEWKFHKYSNRYGVISSCWQIMMAFFNSARWIRKEKIQLIHARSLIPAVIGMLLKKILKIKLLFDIRGFAIDEKIVDGRLKANSILCKVLKKIEAVTYKNADHVVTLTHISKPIIEQKYTINGKNITVIPTCANVELFNPVHADEKVRIRKSIGFAQDDFIVLRNGSVNSFYDIDAEIQLFKELATLDSKVRFIFLNKDQHSLIRTYIDKYNLDECRCKIISATFNQVPSFLNIADICVFFVKPSFAKQASAPTKFAEVVACHLPAATNSDYGDMAYYFKHYPVGVLLELAEIHLAPKGAAQKIFEFVKINRNKKNTQCFDDLFSQHFSKQIAVAKYQNIYDILCPKNRI